MSENENAGSQKTTPKSEVDAKEASRRVAVRMKRGTYVGLGCPDPDKRFRDEDKGHGYTHDHPALAFWKPIEETDELGNKKEIYEYVRGEIVVLHPILKHEEAAASSLSAAEKRFTFSAKEADKRAAAMKKNGTAELLTGE